MSPWWYVSRVDLDCAFLFLVLSCGTLCSWNWTDPQCWQIDVDVSSTWGLCLLRYGTSYFWTLPVIEVPFGDRCPFLYGYLGEMPSNFAFARSWCDYPDYTRCWRGSKPKLYFNFFVLSSNGLILNLLLSSLDLEWGPNRASLVVAVYADAPRLKRSYSRGVGELEPPL